MDNPTAPPDGTACNRSACQAIIAPGAAWWNTSTCRWYCQDCAMRINAACDQFKELRCCMQVPISVSRICVDVSMHVVRGPKWHWDEACHLFHLDYNHAELDAFALSLGMKRSWRHDLPGFIHYDLHPATRAKAVAAGAREVSRHDPDYCSFLRSRCHRAAAERGDRIVSDG